MTARRIAFALCFSACNSHRVPPDARAATHALAPARCVDEIAHGSVALVPGTGGIETVLPACGPAHTLAVYTLRGHTLARTTRSLARVSPFAPPVIVATGADRLGPIGVRAFDGPLAWRSPTVPGLDEMLDREQWWTATIEGTVVQRGSVLWPAGAVALGITAPVAHTRGATTVLGSMAGAQSPPSLVRTAVQSPRDDVPTLPAMPPSPVVGELRAIDVEGGAAIAFVGNAEGTPGTLTVLDVRGDIPVERSRIALADREVLVVARGVAGGGGSWFAYASFGLAAPGSAGCLALDERLCVVPGKVTFVHSTAAGMQRIETEPGLPDSLSVGADGTVTVLWVDVQGRPHAGRLAANDTHVQPLTLRPPATLPPFDHPSVIACDDGTWWVAEVQLPAGTDRDSAEEPGLVALPFDCLVVP